VKMMAVTMPGLKQPTGCVKPNARNACRWSYLGRPAMWG
jgi:hypothetical protein